MSVKYITDLEIVASEENITGEENVLMVQDGTAKLIPMNMIKGSGAEMLVVDVSDTTNVEFTDVTIGDAIREAVQNGQSICIYQNNTYMYPIYCKIVSGTDNTTTVTVGVYGFDYNDTVPAAFTYTFAATYVE